MVTYVYYNKQRDTWVVQKMVDGKIYHFGSFRDYDDAVMHRNYCIEHDWSYECRLSVLRLIKPDYLKR